MKTLGIFDVIGPIMHGPSSNHTGGAVRIGYMARQIMNGCPDRFEIGLHPYTLPTYVGQHTHLGIISGLLGIREYEKDCNRAIDIASRKGHVWTVYGFDERLGRNTMQVRAQKNGIVWEITGDSVGGGNIIINAINGIPVMLDGNHHACVVIVPDKDALSCVTQAISKECSSYRLYLGDAPKGVLACYEIKGGPLSSSTMTRIKRACTLFHQINPLSIFVPAEEQEPLFSSFEDLVELCHGSSLREVAIRYESARDKIAREKVLDQMERSLDVMLDTLERGKNGGISLIGELTDPADGKKLLAHADQGNSIVGPSFAEALGNALITSEMNASGERIVAAPTGGSSGILPAVLLALSRRFGLSKDRLLDGCFAAAVIGIIAGKDLYFSGTTSGCQGEVGISAGMAAGAAVILAGGEPEAAFHASAIAMKNLQGLTCDLPASPIEVPCIKRNAIGTAIALAAADMALAGVRSAITPDDVCRSISETAKLLPACLRCTQDHGLGGTKSGNALKARWKEKLDLLNRQNAVTSN